MSRIIAWLGLLSALAGIWLGGPLTGNLLLATEWVRLVAMAGVVFLFGLFALFGRLRRRGAARAIERALMREGGGDDSKVLADRMSDALAQLKKSNGSNYLYDLPWYVIIGPPGAGKTTALVNSGLRFPVSGASAGGLEGFGGTRYCDWWFADDAVLIDTAGRYTSQGSDAEADGASWRSFLKLLKKSRPKQPVNGVILAFSVEDMMRGTPETVARHAETVRARLDEMQTTLRVDLPVYVVFTKADLITGFREFFSAFSQEKREAVWGVTFQTKDRKAQMTDAVGPEFDRLLSHLSTGLIDQMNAEPDEAARISMLSLPAQMAHLRGPITAFLAQVFPPSKSKARAILRGFYFASGTQEGTPFDQALGAIQRLGDAGVGAGKAFAPGFMSGKGKSFFLHDLLRKVIFAERHWVGHSRRALLRTAILRSFAMTVLMVVTLGILGFFGYAYWQNASVLAKTRTHVANYAKAAAPEIGRSLIADPDLRPVLPLLDDLRALPLGYADHATPEPWEDAGLGQRERVHAAAVQAYSDALEQMLRPRMILSLENRFPFWDQDNALAEIFHALKVYLLLGGQGAKNDDDAIRAYFDRAWGQEFGENSPAHAALMGHLNAMLTLDNSRALLVGIQAETVSLARSALSRATLPQLAYALVRDDPDGSLLQGWDPTRIGAGALVWRSGAISAPVPGVFTAEGFQSHVVPKLNAVGDRLHEDQWVLGLANSGAAMRTATLAPRVQDLYAAEFTAQWDRVLRAIELAPVAEDGPRYAVLSQLAASDSSAFLVLLEEVAFQTTLMRPLPQIEEAFATWTAAVSGRVGTRPIDDVLANLGRTVGVLTSSPQPDPEAVRRAIDPLASLRVLLPPPVAGLIDAAEADIRRHAIPPDTEVMRAALADQITAVCTSQIAPFYPLAPSDQSVALGEFASFFGPNGAMERYFKTYLRPHVLLAPPRLQPHPQSPLAEILSPDLLAQFDRAAHIRRAFFPTGPDPRVDLVISHVDSTSDVASARLVINDMLIETVKGDRPVLVQWPGPGAGALLDLVPDLDGVSQARTFSGSPWDVMRLLQSANSRSVQGDRIRATFVAGPRQITYEIQSRTAPNPLSLRALTQFNCPTTLER